MNINITARNITISEKLAELIKMKLYKLSKYDIDIKSADIVLLKESRAEKIDLFIKSKRNSYITKCYSSSFEKTLSKAIHIITNQINKKH